MTTGQSRPNEAQAASWNTDSGRTWVDLQEMLDRLFKPLETLLIEATVAAGGRRLLDVGCGAGATTLAAARALGPDSACTGVDISTPLIARAKARATAEGAANVAFIEADAQTCGFEAGGFDIVMSRLGVMFFDDPEAAFANLRRAARSGARLTFLSWRSSDENPFMTAAERAALPFAQELARRADDTPGQFGLASAARIESILQASGWTSVEVRPVDIACRLAAAELPIYVTRMGPYGRLRGTLGEDVRAAADRAVLAAFDRFLAGGEVRFTSACWLVTAVA
jgi:ubiquinone/menaquinone biosynthesis C-methylase UbiE